MLGASKRELPPSVSKDAVFNGSGAGEALCAGAPAGAGFAACSGGGSAFGLGGAALAGATGGLGTPGVKGAGATGAAATGAVAGAGVGGATDAGAAGAGACAGAGAIGVGGDCCAAGWASAWGVSPLPRKVAPPALPVPTMDATVAAPPFTCPRLSATCCPRGSEDVASERCAAAGSKPSSALKNSSPPALGDPPPCRLLEFENGNIPSAARSMSESRSFKNIFASFLYALDSK